MRATAWIELQPNRSSWDPDTIYGVYVGRLLKRRPKELRPDAVLVKVEIEVPKDAFGKTVRIEL